MSGRLMKKIFVALVAIVAALVAINNFGVEAYVCSPKCAPLAEKDDFKGFMKERCCNFIPCPTPAYNNARYNEFKNYACEHYKACE